MDKVNNIERSELFNKILNKVKELPRANVEGDAVDHPSLSHTLEQLFLEEFEIRKNPPSTLEQCKTLSEFWEFTGIGKREEPRIISMKEMNKYGELMFKLSHK